MGLYPPSYKTFVSCMSLSVNKGYVNGRNKSETKTLGRKLWTRGGENEKRSKGIDCNQKPTV